jgi:small subunit ribosomal protein S13
MPRIAGVTIPGEKRIEIALTYIYGIGPMRSKQILTATSIDPNTRAKTLTDDQLDAIRAAIDASNIVIEGDLRREITANIRRLRDINSYVGSRHAKRLPVHGQRTKTNGRTRRGKRVTMSSGRRGAPSKT